MRRIALGVEYHGALFNGFQKQAATSNTVQTYLERAISRIADEPLSLICAGRTDAGVHASEQVVHFDTLAQRPENAWVKGANTVLPDTIRVQWAKAVTPDFHARFCAIGRIYRYVLCLADIRSACMNKSVTWTRYSLDIENMQRAAEWLIGEHDYSSFRSAQCQAQSPVRRVEYLKFYRHGPFLVMEIKANAFLHHMVRNIVGVMLDIGRGAKSPDWIAQLLSLRDRTQAAPTARPWGLYFVKALYGQQFNLPERPLGPLFLRTH